MSTDKDIIKELMRRIPDVRINFLTFLETDRMRHWQAQIRAQQDALQRVQDSNWSEPRKQRAILKIEGNIGRAKALYEQAASTQKRKADILSAFGNIPGGFYWDDQFDPHPPNPPPPPPAAPSAQT